MENYYQKDHFVVNNYRPDFVAADFMQAYLKNVSLNKDVKTIHIEIDDSDWKNMMWHYLSEKRFENRLWYPVNIRLTHDWEIEHIEWKIKHRWNYSSKSLKFGFRLKLDDKIKTGTFADKKKIITRHLTFDRTGTNEFVYFQWYKELHEQILGYESMMVDLDYYWIFINDRLYGYYLIMDDSKKGVMENREWIKLDEEHDCVIKAKSWKREKSANMVYHESFEDYDDFYTMYRIEEWDKPTCHQEILQLMKDIRDENISALDAKIADWDQIAFYAHYQDLTENKAGVFQNYLMIKKDKKWEISPWDGDLTFLMDARIDKEVVSENPLFALAYKESDLVFEEAKSRLFLGKLLKSAYVKYTDNILLDRKIWSPYIPKDEKYVSEKYYHYVTGEEKSSGIKKYITTLFKNTYKYFIVRNS